MLTTWGPDISTSTGYRVHRFDLLPSISVLVNSFDPLQSWHNIKGTKVASKQTGLWIEPWHNYTHIHVHVLYMYMYINKSCTCTYLSIGVFDCWVILLYKDSLHKLYCLQKKNWYTYALWTNIFLHKFVCLTCYWYVANMIIFRLTDYNDLVEQDNHVSYIKRL